MIFLFVKGSIRKKDKVVVSAYLWKAYYNVFDIEVNCLKEKTIYAKLTR